MKEDREVLITLLPASSVTQEIELKQLRDLMENYIGLRPMFAPLLQLLKLKRLID
jgi:hypothetical protein